MGSFAKTLFVAAMIIIVALIGYTIFPPFHQIMNAMMPTNSSPLVAGFLTIVKYALFIAIPYACYRMWIASRGASK
jgi:hypothetical protein